MLWKEKKIAKETNGLRGRDIKVLRFWNNEALTNINGILEVIRINLNHPPLNPLPSREGKRKRGNLLKGKESMDHSYTQV